MSDILPIAPDQADEVKKIKPDGRWQYLGKTWYWMPWMTYGFVDRTAKGYRVVNFYPTGDFVMGMERRSRRAVYRPTATAAKAAFLSRLPTADNDHAPTRKRPI